MAERTQDKKFRDRLREISAIPIPDWAECASTEEYLENTRGEEVADDPDKLPPATEVDSNG